MADVGQVWKALFGRELEDGWSADQSRRKVISFGAHAPGRVTESEVDEEYEKELQEMLRFVDTCPECREKLRMGAGGDDLDARCSELWRAGMRTGVKK